MMERRRDGIRLAEYLPTALAPSLRQYELDQVQRVTALRKPAVSQPLVGTPLVTPATWTMKDGSVNRDYDARLIVIANLWRCQLTYERDRSSDDAAPKRSKRSTHPSTMTSKSWS